MEQAIAMWRLGPLNLFDKSLPSGHYVLDTSNPAHEQVAHKLIDAAANNTEYSNLWNIRMHGGRKSVQVCGRPQNRRPHLSDDARCPVCPCPDALRPV